jgi:threonine dehydrogenase-like Zn-dependent dehydrogenase
MKAIVFHDVGDTRLDDVSDAKLEDANDAIVRITASAICGTRPAHDQRHDAGHGARDHPRP